MKLGVIAAMTSEIDYLVAHCELVNKIKLKQQIFYQCEIGDYELIVVASGVGKTNATMYTQILIDFFEPNGIINIGIGGALKQTLKPLDLVLGTSFSHHDVSIEQMNNLFPYTSIFKSDAALVKMFGDYIPKENQGLIVSGEMFIAANKAKQVIIETFDPLLVDMETSSMAHCCYINEVPFISIRSVSDLANDEADKSYKVNELVAADVAGKAVLDVLRNISL